MDKQKKEANIQVGKRLRDARTNLGISQAEFAADFGVSEEHYRKYESGATGQCMKDFDIEYYIANCSKEQRNELFDRILAYILRIMKK